MDPLPSSVLAQLNRLPYTAQAGDFTEVSAMTGPDWWEPPARAYSHWLATPHLAPGAACSLQHYSGRLLSVVVMVWALTGRQMSLRPEHWQAQVDQHGATLVVRHQERILLGHVSAAQLGAAVAQHLDPMVEAVRRPSRLTLAAAMGGPASSLAAAFGRVYRGVAAVDRAAVARAAHEAQAALTERAGRELTVLQADDEEPDLLRQHRTTCCLIRLGHGHGTCETCPRLEFTEQVRQQRERHRERPGVPVTWAARS
ncbi:(2Fe-2S)-binding protein [Kineosporia babensis]|uniref:(2Fe-2S)-binding protein n=1 Tax=Kineosporia babensis TaxID=499548 RepID=A0A9X1SWI8_9ACTN|nr:(2Fe-2S)-binding protein [Kineosporia babensis]MCD5314065.1 (2Fe-2S)-binding protein [Kineosporia babensis]